MAKVIKIQSLLYGQQVAEMLAELEKGGFGPEKCIVIAIKGDNLKVASALGQFELIGALQCALESVMARGE
jgi:hypothetical protein